MKKNYFFILFVLIFCVFLTSCDGVEETLSVAEQNSALATMRAEMPTMTPSPEPLRDPAIGPVYKIEGSLSGTYSENCNEATEDILWLRNNRPYLYAEQGSVTFFAVFEPLFVSYSEDTIYCGSSDDIMQFIADSESFDVIYVHVDMDKEKTTLRTYGGFLLGNLEASMPNTYDNESERIWTYYFNGEIKESMDTALEAAGL